MAIPVIPMHVKMNIVFQAFLEECSGATCSLSSFLQCVRQAGNFTMDEIAKLETTLVASSSGTLCFGARHYVVSDALIHDIRLKPVPVEIRFVTPQNAGHVASLYLSNVEVQEWQKQEFRAKLETWQQLRAKHRELQTKLTELNFSILEKDHARYKEMKERKHKIDKTKRMAQRHERQFVSRVKKIPKYKLRQLQKTA